MKHNIWMRTFNLFALVLVLVTCKKDETVYSTQGGATAYPPPPPPIGIAHAPLAHAGNDSTIYVPFSTYNLDASASLDSDKNIISYKVTVTDATNLFSRDTIKITVKEANCVNPNNEIVLKNLSWNFS